MKLSFAKALMVAAIGMAAAATPSVANESAVKVENGVTYVHPRFKGSLGAGWVPLEKTQLALRDSSKRRESVAGFRVETDEQGRSYVWRHPRFKGSIGAGWERVPLERVQSE